MLYFDHDDHDKTNVSPADKLRTLIGCKDAFPYSINLADLPSVERPSSDQFLQQPDI